MDPIPLKSVPSNIQTFKWVIIFLHFWTSLLTCTLQGFPAGLQSVLISPPYNLSNFEYGIFYGITTFPNIILPILIGLYIDKHGIGIYLMIILQILLVGGSVLVTVGVSEISYSLMVVGRFLQGVGAENILLVIKQIILKLASKEESLKNWGINLASIRVALWLSATSGPLIYSWTYSLSLTFLATVIFGVLGCFTFSLSYYFCLKVGILDKITKNDLSENEENGLLRDQTIFEQIRNFVKEANHIYWLIILMTFINFTMRYGLMSEINSLIESASHVTSLEAGYVLGFYCILSASFQIIWGYVFSQVGFYVYAQIIGSVLQIIATFLFVTIFDMDSQYSSFLPLAFWAIGYSMGVTFIFSSIAFVVDKKYYGVAYGLYQSSMDLGGTVGPIVFGCLRDSCISDLAGFFWPLMETAGLQTCDLMLAILILLLDSYGMKVLSQKRQKNPDEKE